MRRRLRFATAFAAGVLALAPASGLRAQAPAVPEPAREAKGRTQPLTVDADKMERFGKQSLVVFSGNVVARRDNSVQYADRMEVYLDEKGDRVLRAISTGGVRIITRDCNTGTAARAEYDDLGQRIVLIGSARVWQDDNVVSGERITIFLSEDRSVVQGGKQERVKAIFYPRESGAKDGAARKSGESCRN